MERDVDQSCSILYDQFDVLLVYLATVETGVDQSVLDPALLARYATVERGVDQSVLDPALLDK